MTVHGDDMGSKDKLIELVKNASQEKRYTIAWDYKYSESFVELEKHSYELLDITLELLENDGLNSTQKGIVIYAIQNIEFEKFKYFLRDLAISYSEGKIDENLVDHCFFPRDDWSHLVIRNYKDPIIREALKICAKSDRIGPYFRNFIRLVLRGKVWEKVRNKIIEQRLYENLDIKDLGPPPFGNLWISLAFLIFIVVIVIVLLIVVLTKQNMA
jgi:hypothetical protein